MDKPTTLEVGKSYTFEEIEKINEARLAESRATGIWEWRGIVFQLLEDPMIESCGCDGLLDANEILNGLLGMSQLMRDDITNEFICKAINAAIKARNHYTFLNGWRELPYVELEDDKFIWKHDSQVILQD